MSLILDPVAAGALVLVPTPGDSLILEPADLPLVTLTGDYRREGHASRWGRSDLGHELRNELDEHTRCRLDNERRNELRHHTRTTAEADE